jgi:uncharacterized damage-inducible protein DinB
LIGDLTEIDWIDPAAAAYTGGINSRQVAGGTAIMKARYRMFADYNAWCNERLYDAAAQVAEADYRADRGAYFKSLHGTLNHLLVGDRIWMRRFTGVGDQPASLDAILYDDFASLRAARRSQDVLISRYIGALSDEDLRGTVRYRTFVNPQTIEQALAPALDHFFNHQAHHRGQAHALLSAMIGNGKTPSFDLIIFQRETGQGGLRQIV